MRTPSPDLVAAAALGESSFLGEEATDPLTRSDRGPIYSRVILAFQEQLANIYLGRTH
jgi:hypothetical protein